MVFLGILVALSPFGPFLLSLLLLDSSTDGRGSLSSPYCLLTLRRERPIVSAQFQGLPTAFEFLFPESNTLPCRKYPES